jgi:carbohydrate kinase (thermoresistant glucokinase family)
MVIVLMGVSGSGKTTIGKILSKRNDVPFFDGDDFHPNVNVQKMAKGIPLTDQDRVVWIEQIADFINCAPAKHKILACSALSKFIRDLMIREIHESCYFVFLKGSYGLIKERMDNRGEHYMKSVMLDSQFEALEEPEIVLIIDIENSPDQICDIIHNAIWEDGL